MGMGGALEGLLKRAGKGIGEGFESLYKGARSREGTSIGMDFFASQRREFMLDSPGDAGPKVQNMLDAFDMKKAQYLSQYTTPIQGLHSVLKNQPDLLTQTLNQIDTALPANHPGKQFTTQLQSLSNFGNLTLKQISEAAAHESAAMAKLAVGRRNMSAFVDAMMPLFQSQDPVMHSRANTMLDIIANHFQDTQMRKGVEVSSTKFKIRAELARREKAAVRAGGTVYPYRPGLMKVGSVWEKQNEIERWASRRTRFFLAPFIVLPHLATAMNFSWAPLTAIGKMLATLSDRQIMQTVEASGIFNSLLHGMVDEDLRATTGLVGRKVNPTVARLIGKTIHTPGFNYLRKAQLWAGGILGYHSAQYWAEAAMRGDERAILELKEMKIDVNALRARGGGLTPEEKQTAIWHFVNNRAFIDRSMDRAFMSTKNPWMRMLTMFHGYVMDQQAFMRRELMKMLNAGDYAGIARYAGTVLLAFPAIAPAIHSLEIMARQGSVKQGVDTLKGDYETLAHPGSAGKFLYEYFDMLSFFGTVGVLHSYLAAAKNDRLSLQLLGPVYGSAARMGQDVINYALHPSKKGVRNPRPLAKDILQQTVPGYGNILANKLFPPKKKGRQ